MWLPAELRLQQLVRLHSCRPELRRPCSELRLRQPLRLQSWLRLPSTLWLLSAGRLPQSMWLPAELRLQQFVWLRGCRPELRVRLLILRTPSRGQAIWRSIATAARRAKTIAQSLRLAAEGFAAFRYEHNATVAIAT